MQISIEEKHKKRKSFEPHGGKNFTKNKTKTNILKKKIFLNLKTTKKTCNIKNL